MDRNALRVVCNPYDDHISYYFLNEKGIWTVLSSDSPLSRQHYTNATMKECANDIVQKIDEVYNRNNRGLDVFFEGTQLDYDLFLKAFNNCLPERDIKCSMGVTKIAVVGKINTGKTCLIEGMENLQKYKYSVEDFSEYFKYSDEGNHAEWYEVKGIELGIENVERAYKTVKSLAEDGLSAIVYCLNATFGRLENVEKNFLMRIVEEFPSITVLFALTMCINADSEDIISEFEKLADRIKVIPVLAKEYEIESIDDNGEEKSFIKKPYGLDILSKYIFERR